MDDEHVLTALRRVVARLPGAEESVLQDRPLFHVARRRFAIFDGATSPPRRRWNGRTPSLHFLADPDERDALRHDDRFSPSPHHGDRGWFAIALDDATDWAEIAELLEQAHAQVARR